MSAQFIHLECQSEYSITNSTIRIKNLVKQATSLKMNAIALTDNNCLFSAIKFYNAAIDENIKPIFGAKITIIDDFEYQITVLCMNKKGYLNLSTLISLSYEKTNKVFITFSELEKFNQDLIIISSINSSIGQLLINNKDDVIIELDKFNKMLKNRHYLGISRTDRNNENKHLKNSINLALTTNTAIVATNDVQFLQQTEFSAHEARVCISEGGLIDDDKRISNYSDQQYLKSSMEMLELFDDIPEAIENTNEIAKRCNMHFELHKKNYLPEFPIQENLTIAEFFTKESQNGLDKIIVKHKLDTASYYQRLKSEIDIILTMDFPGYFLIVADFIKWSKDNNIPVGPGRGSGAGSLVAYALGITNVDPLKYGLLFERFLNPERVSMPDFDIDFCTSGRDKVINYVATKYGREKVSQIITFGTLGAKGVIRDVGRVMGQGYGWTDTLSKLIPNDLDININKALNYEQHLSEKAKKDKKDFAKIKSSKEKELQNTKELSRRYSTQEGVTSLIDLSIELEGLARNTGTHAGGVVIAPSSISNFCPIYKGSKEDDVIVSQFDKDDVEAVGLVKFDFLGLSNLSVIAKAVKTIKQHNLTDKDIDINDIPLDDPRVFKLYQTGDTTGIFQVESSGMREYLKCLKPTNFNDIVAMLALYRPGAMDYVDDYIAVKHGRKISFPHSILKEILEPTNGVFVYQEQVMQAAQNMAGFSLGNADLLRRAMGKKKPEEMAKQRQSFVDGALKINSIDAKKANEIFDYIDKFAGYGFNKSHSVAYALISYQTAWLKTHYRAAFMAAVISGVMGDTDRVAFMIDEITNSGIKIFPPSVNYSNFDFVINNKQQIIYGLGAIKGLGLAFIEQITLNRASNYTNLFDFCQKIEKKYLNKRGIKALIYAGAFDEFGETRATLIKNYKRAVHQAEIKQKDLSTGQTSLFASSSLDAKYNKVIEYNFRKKLEIEKSVMGFYFHAHPVDEFIKYLDLISATELNKTKLRGAKEIRVLALVEKIFYRESKKGQMANVLLKDGSSELNAMVFNDTLLKISDKLEVGKVVIASCIVRASRSTDEKYKNNLQITINDIDEVDVIKAKYAKCFEIFLQNKDQQKFYDLKNILLQNKGKTPVVLHYNSNGAIGFSTLNEKYNVFATSDLTIQIDVLLQNKSSNIKYY